jgi:hypothetical protein
VFVRLLLAPAWRGRGRRQIEANPPFSASVSRGMEAATGMGDILSLFLYRRSLAINQELQ